MPKPWGIKLATLLLLISSSALSSNKLTIVGEHSPPYLFEHQNRVVGIDAEIIRHIFDRLNVKYDMSLCPRARCKEMIKRGQADIGISFPQTPSLDPFVHYPKIFSRDNEFVLVTNKDTKFAHDVTSLSYAKKNGLLLGVVRGESYNKLLWELFPFRGKKLTDYNAQIYPVIDIAYGFKMLNINRIDTFIADELSARFTAKKLKLKNIRRYDFISFFQPTTNVFGTASSFKNAEYENLPMLLKAYDRELEEFKQLPSFYHIFNWGWDDNAVYKPEKNSETNYLVGDEINIGFLGALSGPSSGWGKPGLTGIKLFLSEINARGGLLVGNTRYPLKLSIYDDKSDPKLALKGAKELVNKHQVKFISGIGGASADATHPYLTDKKVIYASLIATDIKPDRPYLLAGGDVTPRIDMLRPWFHKNKNPILKRWAVVSQNDPIAQSSQAWEVGSAIAEGWDVVYDKHFPLNTKDFSTIVADILATKPDVVSLNLTWPGFVEFILQELFTQGYRGEISGNYMDVEANLKRVPSWFHEGTVDSFPLFNDPFWGKSSKQYQFYQKWLSRFGTGASEDVKRRFTGIDWDHVIMLKVWAFGAQLAKTFDPEKIIRALRAQKSFPTLLGNASMSGEEMWGIENMVSPPIPINEVRNGVKRIQTIKKFDTWFESKKDEIITIVKEKGYYWKK